MGRKFGGWGTWLTGLVVVLMAGGFLPSGLLADHRGWFTALVWVGYGIAAGVVIAVGIRLLRGKGRDL